jgi:hypothetical protein
MRGKVVAIFLFTAGILLFSIGSSAHHGASVVYDLNQEITLSGTVTAFQFVNPHALVFFDVTGEDGTVVGWLAGLGGPNGLARREGWSRDTLKPGDQVTITGPPARGGAASLWGQKIHLNGTQVLGEERVQ